MGYWNEPKTYRCPSLRCGRKLAMVRLPPGGTVEIKCPYCRRLSVFDSSGNVELVVIEHTSVVAVAT